MNGLGSSRLVPRRRLALRSLARPPRPRRGDVVAGISVALVAIPQSLAYGQLAGMPAHRGLFAAALPPVAAALVASSPYLQTGPVAITSILAFGALSALEEPGTPEYVRLGLLLALLVGAIRVLVGVVRAGAIAYLVSQPMLLGFVPAAAILIIASQLPAAVGADDVGGSVLGRAARALLHPEGWGHEPIPLALCVIGIVLLGRRVHRLFPAVPLAAVGAILYSGLAGYDGATVGPVTADFPPISIDVPWGESGSLVVAAAVIALVGFAEPSSIARTFATLDRRRWDANREFVSQGIANLTAGLSGGFPVGGSFSRSALNRLTGAETRWSGAVTGLAVLAFLPAAGLLSPLPTAALAALVMAAVAGLVRVGPIVRLARFSRPQCGVAIATFGLTLALSPRIDRALVIGVFLAVAVHLWRERALEVTGWREEETLHLRPRGVLWFGSIERLEQGFLRLLAEHADARRLAVHLDALGRLDSTGALSLRSLLQQARAAGLEAEVVEARPRWRPLVERVIESEHDPLGSAL